jgi:hypothetical protein
MGKWDAKPDPDRSGEKAGDARLRETNAEEGKVEIRRELGGDGHLARGDRTRFHTLNFTAHAIPRTERDPVFTARDEVAAEADTGEGAGSSASPAPPLPPPPSGVAAESGGVIARIKRWMGGS